MSIKPIILNVCASYQNPLVSAQGASATSVIAPSINSLSLAPQNCADIPLIASASSHVRAPLFEASLCMAENREIPGQIKSFEAAKAFFQDHRWAVSWIGNPLHDWKEMEALYPGQEEEGLSSFLGQCREMPTFWPFLAQTGYKRMADSQNFDLCVSAILSDRNFKIINQLFSSLIVHSFGNLPNMFSPGINKLDDSQKSIVKQHMESLGIKPDPSLSPNWFLQYPMKYRRLALLFAQRLFPLLFNLCSPSPPIAPRDPAWEGLKRAVAHSLLQTEFPSSLVEHKDRLCGGRSYARGEIENFFAYPSDIELPGENSIQWCGGRQSRIQLWRDHVKACLAEMVSHNANILMTLVFPPEFSREGLGILRQGYINVVRKELRDAQDRDGNQKFGAEKLRVVIKLSREERGQVFRRVGDVMEYALRSDK